MIRNSPIILKKWTMNTSVFKEEFTRITVWVKLYDVPLQVFLKDGISLIASQIGKPIMLDSFTNSMCIDSWGRSSFARCFIEVKADEVLKDSITMGIPLPEAYKPKVKFKSKAHGNSPKNETPNVSTSANDSLSIVHTSSKKQPAKFFLGNGE
ncbi:zinc knuckle CX2CX4HX4C containing protein [Tanacetum coccineum]